MTVRRVCRGGRGAAAGSTAAGAGHAALKQHACMCACNPRRISFEPCAAQASLIRELSGAAADGGTCTSAATRPGRDLHARCRPALRWPCMGRFPAPRHPPRGSAACSRCPHPASQPAFRSHDPVRKPPPPPHPHPPRPPRHPACMGAGASWRRPAFGGQPSAQWVAGHRSVGCRSAPRWPRAPASLTAQRKRRRRCSPAHPPLPAPQGSNLTSGRRCGLINIHAILRAGNRPCCARSVPCMCHAARGPRPLRST